MLIQWGEDRQRIWAVPCESENKSAASKSGGGNWIVVIHGGAWRDEKITQQSAANVFAHLDTTNLSGMCSVDYRLSPKVEHPAHVQDVKQGICEIITRFKPTSITLVGHSCGAFLCGQVYFEFPHLVTSVIVVEGIYNLQLLVDEYPSYEGFLSEAFGPQTQKWPSIDWKNVPVSSIVHSREDELLSLVQPNWLASEVGVEPYLLERGKHDEVYEQLDEWVALCTRKYLH